ncbi:MAG: polysaccharide biosynthesis C-terminal domain-containing protein, partial [Candidatus Roizmanbacteria bacterium]|nr:polysaccharide biosynthesis C-terminal domain-containing protein [Candidatus Roizmanbacteria bacterium]
RIFNFPEQLLTGIAMTTVLLVGYITSCNMVFQLTHRYDRSVLASVVGGSVGVGLLLLLPHTVGSAVSAIATGYAITALLCYWFAHQLSSTLSFFPTVETIRSPSYRQQLRTLFMASLPVGLMLFLNTMYSHVDIFIISAYQGNDAVALYQLAYKFFEFPLAFATFFANAIFPHYVALYQDNRSRFYTLFNKGMMGLFAVSILFTAGIWVIAPFLTFIKPEYAASIVPLQILSLSYPIFFLTSPLSWLLFLQRREWALVVIYGASFTVNIVSNLIFVPVYGYIASSWITLIGELGVLAALASCAYLWHTRHS